MGNITVLKINDTLFYLKVNKFNSLYLKSLSDALYPLNSLITKKQMTKFLSANFQKMLSPSYIISISAKFFSVDAGQLSDTLKSFAGQNKYLQD